MNINTYIQKLSKHYYSTKFFFILRIEKGLDNRRQQSTNLHIYADDWKKIHDLKDAKCQAVQQPSCPTCIKSIKQTKYLMQNHPP